MMKNKEYSENEKAKELCGLRKPGQPLFCPHELGYACPICGAADEVNLHWSEYNFFLWCKKCNLDIPSCLCVKYYEPRLSNKPMPIQFAIQKSTELFLSCIEEAKK